MVKGTVCDSFECCTGLMSHRQRDLRHAAHGASADAPPTLIRYVPHTCCGTPRRSRICAVVMTTWTANRHYDGRVPTCAIRTKVGPRERDNFHCGGAGSVDKTEIRALYELEMRKHVTL